MHTNVKLAQRFDCPPSRLRERVGERGTGGFIKGYFCHAR